MASRICKRALVLSWIATVLGIKEHVVIRKSTESFGERAEGLGGLTGAAMCVFHGGTTI